MYVESTMAVRQPAVAGQFYSARREDLLAEVEKCYTHPLGPGRTPPSEVEVKELAAYVAPHAGYMYSGPVAAHTYYWASGLRRVELVVVVGPNHWGVGSGVATVDGGVWVTPLGEVEVDREAARALVRESGIVDIDESAHRFEHSLEVQLPFLQHIFQEGFKLLPVTMRLQDRATAEEVGRAIAKIVAGRRALLVASSDFTHYEPHDSASKKDRAMIEAIEALDVVGMYSRLERMNISACGYGAIAAIMVAARELGSRAGKLLKYATSGDVTGDRSSVVGYAAIDLVRPG
jgi:hypothetical protein